MGRRRHTVLGIVGIVAAALVVATLSLTGCGGGGDSSIKLTSETPSGFKTHKVEGMKFAVPKDWKVVESSDLAMGIKIAGTDSKLIVWKLRAEDIEDSDSLNVYKSDSLDKDVEKHVKSSTAKGIKVKSTSKGKDGSAAVYRFELAGKAENGEKVHGYWQYTFSGDHYYITMAVVPEKNFSDKRDDILAVLNSQKLSDPEAPEKAE